MNDKTLVERLRRTRPRNAHYKDDSRELINPDGAEAATRIDVLEAALRDIKNAVLQGGMTDIVAWQRLVIACQTTAKQALEGSGNG